MALGKKITKTQSVEVGKFCLNLCQVTLVGTLGSFYVSKLNIYVNVILVLSGIIICMLLFAVSIKLFEEVN